MNCSQNLIKSKEISKEIYFAALSDFALQFVNRFTSSAKVRKNSNTIEVLLEIEENLRKK